MIRILTIAQAEEWDNIVKYRRTFRALADIVELASDFPDTATTKIEIVVTLNKIADDYSKFSEV